MNKIEIMLNDFNNAPEGALLVKKKGIWQPVLIEELIKDVNARISVLEGLKNDFRALTENNKHFIDYCKSHFMVVFNSFVNQVLIGEIVLSESETELLKLGDKVIYDEITIQDAILKHPYLEKLYKKLYLDKTEYKYFPEV